MLATTKNQFPVPSVLDTSPIYCLLSHGSIDKRQSIEKLVFRPHYMHILDNM